MLKDFTIANMLDMTQTIAGELFQGKTYPWEVLPEIGDFIVKLGKTLDPDEYDYLEGDIWIAKSAKVAPTACINGTSHHRQEYRSAPLCIYPRQSSCRRGLCSGKLHRA